MIDFAARFTASSAALVQSTEREVTYELLPGTDGLLSTVYNVEVCATGIEYPLASGPMTFTEEDLVHAVASQDDPAIQSPRVWLGHPDDDRFHAGRATQAGSAEPALGKVTNMRIEDNGQVIVGEIAGCPTWLAKVLASAYPSRSIEGFKEAETVTGHTWNMVITDLALLGVRWPGVSTIEDLQMLYSAEGPDNIEVIEDMQLTAASGLQAQSSVEDIRRAFYLALPEMAIDKWSWIRAIQLEPDELIVDDDEGGLHRIPFTIKGEEVEFSDPVQVKIKYVNASQRTLDFRAELTRAFTHGHKVLASWDNPDESRPADNKENQMTPEEIRKNLGLAADATDEQVRARLDEVNQAVPPVEPAPAATPSGSQTPDPVEVPEPVAASTPTNLPEGMIAVPADQWASVQATVATLSQKDQRQEETNDAQLLQAALNTGKVPPAQKDFYASKLKDPHTREAFRHLLTAPVEQGGLMANMVPVEARGTDPSTSLEAGAAGSDAYPTEWLPEVARQGDPAASRITTEV